MKIEKQISATTVLDPRSRTQAQGPLPSAGNRKGAAPQPQAALAADARVSKDAGFSLQLNQQLSAMQTADAYLGQLGAHLGQLKLGLGRQLANPQSDERTPIEAHAKKANELLAKRAKLSAGSLDANLSLKLNEPLRSRFRLEGLDSIDAIQDSGRETLLFRAGRHIAEPVAVVPDDNLDDQQVLRRFNASLGQTGIRAELDEQGALRFSAPEAAWLNIRDQLMVQGEGKLFERAFKSIASVEEGISTLPTDLSGASARELRQYLDQVLTTLDRVGSVREQLGQRQSDVASFLARQENQDDAQWAMQFATRVFSAEGKTGYSQVSQAVIAQANIGRFAVVSLLS